MSDHCYIHLTGRMQDLARFIALDLVDQDDGADPEADIVEMIDEESNLCIPGGLPQDIPHYGEHGEGYEYGAGEWACDGMEMAYIATHQDGGVSMEWDGMTNAPSPESIRRVQRFRHILARAKAIIEGTPIPAPAVAAPIQEIHVILDGGIVQEVRHIPAGHRVLVLDMDVAGSDDDRIEPSPIDQKPCFITSFDPAS